MKKRRAKIPARRFLRESYLHLHWPYETSKLLVYDLSGKWLAAFSLEPGLNKIPVQQWHAKRGMYLLRIQGPKPYAAKVAVW